MFKPIGDTRDFLSVTFLQKRHNETRGFPPKMTPKKHQIISLVILIVVLISINYPFLDQILSKELSSLEKALVVRVIDGDTIEVKIDNLNNQTETIRLLGINTTERGEEYYKNAKEYLEKLILNKTIDIEKGREDEDLYGRLLRYIHYNNLNVNLNMIEQGFANPYFPTNKDRYYSQFFYAWKNCVNQNKKETLCELSINICNKCIQIESIDVGNQKVVLENKCNFICDINSWKIKDEGRKQFIFPNLSLNPNSEINLIVSKTKLENNVNNIYWIRKDYVWTETGDTLFLRDNEGKIVLWKSIYN